MFCTSICHFVSFPRVRGILVGLLACGVGISLTAAAHAQNRVGEPGTGCIYPDLAAALAGGSPTLILRADYVASNANFSITQDVTLQGGDANCAASSTGTRPVLDGAGAFRPLSVSLGAHLTLDYIEVRNGYAALQGGNILVLNGELTAINSVISNGVAGTDGGGVAVMDGMSATFQDVFIAGNVANQDGGGIYVGEEASVEVIDTQIGGAISVGFGNVATDGGGVFVDANGQVTLTGRTQVIGNTADDGGGVFAWLGNIEMIGPDIEIGDSKDGNEAAANGGGIVVVLGQLTATGGYIVNNVAGGYGGGVFATSSTVNMSGDVLVSGNVAQFGGGLALDGSGTTLERTTVSHNDAEMNGGGVWVTERELILRGATLSENSAEGSGGGLYLYAADLVGQSAWFTDNTASVGGGIAAYGNALDFVEPNIALIGRRVSGACEFRDNVDPTQPCSQLANNEASIGGGLFTDAGTAILNRTVLQGNEASVVGAAIVLWPHPVLDASAALINALVVQHNAPNAGVVVAGDGTTLNGDQVTVTDNVGTPIEWVAGSSGSFRRSIVWDPDPIVIDPGVTIPAACTAFEAVPLGGTTIGPGRTFGDDPLLLSDYQLDPASPSIDACATGAPVDLLSEARPIDLSGNGTPWDRGAFERH